MIPNIEKYEKLFLHKVFIKTILVLFFDIFRYTFYNEKCGFEH